MRRVHSMPFGAEITSDGVRFALWAPTAREVSLVLDGAEHPLRADREGWYRHVSQEARPESRYGYRIDGNLVVPDPASRFQPDDVHGVPLLPGIATERPWLHARALNRGRRLAWRARDGTALRRAPGARAV